MILPRPDFRELCPQCTGLVPQPKTTIRACLVHRLRSATA